LLHPASEIHEEGSCEDFENAEKSSVKKHEKSHTRTFIEAVVYHFFRLKNPRCSFSSKNEAPIILPITEIFPSFSLSSFILKPSPSSASLPKSVFITTYSPENSSIFDFSQYDYIVDAIDSVTGKIDLCVKATQTNTPIISSMGAGNKLDATAFKVADIYQTKVCPLAKVMRRELKARGVKKLKVVYSEEEPIKSTNICCADIPEGKRQIPASIAFVPSVVGLIIAGEVIKDLIKA